MCCPHQVARYLRIQWDMNTACKNIEFVLETTAVYTLKVVGLWNEKPMDAKSHLNCD